LIHEGVLDAGGADSLIPDFSATIVWHQDNTKQDIFVFIVFSVLFLVAYDTLRRFLKEIVAFIKFLLLF